MSVNPGFGGQSFIDSALDKLKSAKKIIDDSNYGIRLEIACNDNTHIIHNAKLL